VSFHFAHILVRFCYETPNKGLWLPSGEVWGILAYFREITKIRAGIRGDGIIVSVVYPYITLTNFEKNTIREIKKNQEEEEPHGQYPPDTAEFVAQKILEGIRSGDAKIFAHDWMKRRSDEEKQSVT
jgi:hypothetical protein